jgi:hypothetical protein
VANEQLYNFISKQLNPLDPKTRLSSARPDILIDDPLSAYRKTLGATLSTNIFEGVQSYYGIVLLNFKVNKKQTFYWNLLGNTFGGILNWFTSGDENDSKTFCFCMVPELHAHLGIPFDHGYDTPEYIKRSLRFPIFMDNRGLDAPEDPAALQPGNIVNIVFSDTNLSNGVVTGTLIASSTDAIGGSPSPTATHEDGDTHALADTPRGPPPGFETADPGFLDPEFYKKIEQLLRNVRARGGHTFEYRATYRDSVRQDHYRQMGYSTITKGFHNNVNHETGVPASLAADLSPTNASGKEGQAAAYRVLMEEAKALGLETGGEWSTSAMGMKSEWKKFDLGWDPGHVQFRGLNNWSDVVTKGEFEGRST